uniref:Uncharacterized protein n=1 Tax=Arundo donax TaxID=35708 RepID=A0A0A9HVZ5_ARUDO
MMIIDMAFIAFREKKYSHNWPSQHLTPDLSPQEFFINIIFHYL